MRGFTLIELLIVVAVIAVLATIALPNFREAQRRAERSACAGNLKAVASGLALYRVDWGKFPLSDGVAGAQDSRTQTQFANGPAGNGYWNAVPNALVFLGYLGDRNALFCPTLRKTYRRNPERLRYAYNAGALDSNAFVGGSGAPIDGVGAGGNTWIARCLFINAKTIAPDRFVPFPHGPDVIPGDGVWGDENVLDASLAVTSQPGKAP